MNPETSYIMVIETSDYLHRLEANQFNLFTQKLHNGISKALKKFVGTIMSHNDNTYVVSFELVTNAILCALKLQSNFKYITPKFDKSIRRLKIGVAQNDGLNNGKTLATRMCEIVKDQIVITSLVKQAYEKENRNTFINKEHIRTLNPSEKAFLTDLIDYVETVWNDSNFSVADLSKPLQYSSSQVYRKVVSLTGMTPSSFIRNFRLRRAMYLMHHKKGNIMEVTKKIGFVNPTYFSKCFKERFNILPSKYIQQHA